MQRKDSKMEIYTRVKISKTNKILIILLVLLPIINQYAIGPFTFLELFSFVVFVREVIVRKELEIKGLFGIYIGYVVLITIAALFYTSTIQDVGISTIALRLVKFVIVMITFYCIIPNKINLEYLMKIYTYVVYTVSIVLFLQYLLYLVTGQGTMFLIPNMTLNYNNGINSSDFMSSTLGRIFTGYYYRPCSVFVEPAYQVVFVLPWMALKMFNKESKSMSRVDYFMLLIVTSSLLLTTSTTALIICLVLWWIFIARALRTGGKMAKRIWSLVPLIIIAVVWLAQQSGLITSIVIKMNSLSNIRQYSSLTLRLLRGIECYRQENLFVQLFGCGYGNITQYFSNIQMHTMYDGSITDIAYMSGFFTMLCSVGLFGSAILIVYLIKIVRRGKGVVTILFICWFLMMISSSCFDGDTYLLLIALMTFCMKDNSNNKSVRIN